MSKANWLSGVLTVGSMVVAGYATYKAKQQKELKDYAWELHDEVQYDLNIAKNTINELEGMVKDRDEMVDSLMDSCEGYQNSCDKWIELCEKQREQIKELRQELINELIKK